MSSRSGNGQSEMECNFSFHLQTVFFPSQIMAGDGLDEIEAMGLFLYKKTQKGDFK